MSRGSAAVEGKLYVNKECLVENLKGLVVHGRVSATGAVAMVDITKSLVDWFVVATSGWRRSYERQKQERIHALKSERKNYSCHPLMGGPGNRFAKNAEKSQLLKIPVSKFITLI